ncbi:MAG: NAD-dependent succinate-semialdehyde dehydrogenase [bacterium]|nr:NAD-dependent succinate-semialdehyde dehydrogenase [bacterium]
MKSFNPATNELIKEYPDHSPEEAAQIVDASHQAWQSWKSSSFAERSAKLKACAEVMRRRAEPLAQRITAEMGKSIKEARGEVEKCAWVCDYYAEEGPKMLADEMVQTQYHRSMVHFQPIGVVLAVMPWNYPFWQVWRFLAPALMAGNAGVLKHAGNVTGSALDIESVVAEAGLPKDLFRTLVIGSRDVAEVIRHPKVRAVTLTGSEYAGSQVAMEAGKALKKCVLELGGTDAFIVLADADLDQAAATAAKSRMNNMGQTCIAAKRFIVEAPVAEAFGEKLKAQLEQYTPGDPADEGSRLCPLARPDLLEEIHEQVTRSVSQGAQLVTGGKKLDIPGNYYAPTLLKGITPKMAVYREEVFGPVASIIVAQSAEDAVAIANDSNYGLGGSLWTQDLEKGERLAKLVETGAIFVNQMTLSDPRLPFGGVKMSGYGRELSHYGIKEFMNIQTVVVNKL